MMNLITFKRKMIRFFCSGICLALAIFVLQTCSDSNDSEQVLIRGTIFNASTNEPVSSIGVWCRSAKGKLQLKDVSRQPNGKYQFNTDKQLQYSLKFEDMGTSFLTKDTVVNFSGNEIELKIYMTAK